MVIGTQTSVVYEESLTFPSISPVGLHVQEHSHDSSKGESHCVNVRVLTRFSCHFHHLLLVVCLKRFKKVRVMDNPGLVLPSCMPNVCVWNPLVMSSTFGVLVCPWTGQTQSEISFQSLRNKYIISCYTRVQYLCFSNYILCIISLWKPDKVEYCYGSFSNRENWSMEGFSHGALLVQNCSFSSFWNSFSRKHKI